MMIDATSLAAGGRSGCGDYLGGEAETSGGGVGCYLIDYYGGIIVSPGMVKRRNEERRGGGGGAEGEGGGGELLLCAYGRATRTEIAHGVGESGGVWEAVEVSSYCIHPILLLYTPYPPTVWDMCLGCYCMGYATPYGATVLSMIPAIVLLYGICHSLSRYVMDDATCYVPTVSYMLPANVLPYTIRQRETYAGRNVLYWCTRIRVFEAGKNALLVQTLPAQYKNVRKLFAILRAKPLLFCTTRGCCDRLLYCAARCSAGAVLVEREPLIAQRLLQA
eukprot:3940778-Rhodomonas_salina.1